MKKIFILFYLFSICLYIPFQLQPNKVEKEFIKLNMYDLCTMSKTYLNIKSHVYQYSQFLIKNFKDLKNIPIRYRLTVSELCFMYDVPVKLVYNIVLHESGWDPLAVNKYNRNQSIDIGLMQLNSNYIEYFTDLFFSGINFNPYNGHHSLEVGIRYLRFLHDTTNHWKTAVIAYNYGLSNVGKPEYRLPTRVRIYVKNVLS